MTFPETVSIHNIDNMKTLVQNGPDHHPGARSIIRADGKRVDLRFVKTQADQILGTQFPRFTRTKIQILTQKAMLDFGYIVERQMQDDDCVIFNRQPSLHKMSMMGHRVKVSYTSSLRPHTLVA
jgi:DNA-directed RNA polymerase II subunit RPB1